jgi:HlyD family secretion protein
MVRTTDPTWLIPFFKIIHMKQPKIFRQTALEHLSSPEQLDRLVTLTSPKGWLALLTLCILLSGIVVWGIYGHIPTRVQGDGILVSQGGRVFDAYTKANGLLSVVTVSIGDFVKKDQVIARLEQMDLEQKYQHALSVSKERQREYAQLTAAFKRELQLKKDNFAQQRTSLRDIIKSAQQRLVFQENTLKLMEQKAGLGYISRLDIEQTREKYHALHQEIHQHENEIHQLDAEELDIVRRQQQELTNSEQNLNEAKRQVDELKLQLAQSSQVVSPDKGRVTEVKAAPGSIVTVGTPIISLESTGANLQLVLYIPPVYGKKIKPDMEVRITPAPVRKEEYGTLIGKVVDISEFPATSQGMASVLQNDSLVRQFSQQGPPYAARVNLIPNNKVPSGYQWSSGEGPAILLTSGTLAAAEVTVTEQAPISLVIPYFKKYTGLGL